MNAGASVQTDKTKETILELEKEMKGILGDKPVSAEELTLAQKNLTIALKAYEQGSISDIDMRETQRSFVDVSYRLINAQINLKDTEVELRRISGTLTLPDQQ